MKLIFPQRILDQHLIMLGKTGAGKSSALRHIVEWLLYHQKRVCIIDPKGDWWGLKFSSDGKSEGMPVIMFGDFKEARAQDVPINDRSGHHLAELIADGNRPCVIGMGGWQIAQMTRFWIDFASGLFSRNKGELYVVGDEFHHLAPKGQLKGRDGNTTMCLHWSNRILSEGRGIGIVCLLASQRPQKVHNDTLTSCETLCAMRVVHSADRQAVKDWIDGCGDPERGTAVLKDLAGMGRGEAFVWSPEIGFGPERLKFPMFTTFDSFAPPQLQKKVSSATWSNVDLDAVKKKLEGVIAEAAANDPAELKRQIRELEHNLNVKVREIARWKENPEVKQAEPIKEPVFDKECKELLENTQRACQHAAQESRRQTDQLEALYKSVVGILPRVETSLAGARRTTVPRPVVRAHNSAAIRPAGDVSTNGELTGPQRSILQRCIELEERGIPAGVEVIAAWLDLHPNGGSFRANIRHLNENGYLDNFIVQDRSLIKSFQTGMDSAIAVLTGPQRQIMDALAQQEHTVESLAETLGLHPNGGSFRGNLRRLRVMGLITGGQKIKLSEAAFK